MMLPMKPWHFISRLRSGSTKVRLSFAETSVLMCRKAQMPESRGSPSTPLGSTGPASFRAPESSLTCTPVSGAISREPHVPGKARPYVGHDVAQALRSKLPQRHEQQG